MNNINTDIGSVDYYHRLSQEWAEQYNGLKEKLSGTPNIPLKIYMEETLLKQMRENVVAYSKKYMELNEK